MPSGAGQIAAILERRLGVDVHAVRTVAGGSINAALRVDTSEGPLFVKTSASAAPGTYWQEAAGLQWLGEVVDGPPVAEPVLVHDVPVASALPDEVPEPGEPRFLALRWIEPGPAGPQAEERFGRALAHLHAARSPDGFGSVPLLRASGALAGESGSKGGVLKLDRLEFASASRRSFAAFWAEERVLPLARLAHEGGAFSAADVALMERLAARMPELTGPPERPSRTHGDLWSGNAYAGPGGQIHLIDPLAHGSHREVDLATLRVFGGPGERCFAAYREIFPLADGHQERIPLMQLATILIHVVLFGGSYAEQARRIARRYV